MLLCWWFGQSSLVERMTLWSLKGDMSERQTQITHSICNIYTSTTQYSTRRWIKHNKAAFPTPHRSFLRSSLRSLKYFFPKRNPEITPSFFLDSFQIASQMVCWNHHTNKICLAQKSKITLPNYLHFSVIKSWISKTKELHFLFPSIKLIPALHFVNWTTEIIP